MGGPGPGLEEESPGCLGQSTKGVEGVGETVVGPVIETRGWVSVVTPSSGSGVTVIGEAGDGSSCGRTRCRKGGLRQPVLCQPTVGGGS